GPDRPAPAGGPALGRDRGPELRQHGLYHRRRLRGGLGRGVRRLQAAPGRGALGGGPAVGRLGSRRRRPSGGRRRRESPTAGGPTSMTESAGAGGRGVEAHTAKLPRQMMPLEISAEAGYVGERHGFMAGRRGVRFTVAFNQRLGAGVFGGGGFRMQRLGGQG